MTEDYDVIRAEQQFLFAFEHRQISRNFKGYLICRCEQTKSPMIYWSI
jgi:hypothetical protein